jgi:glycerol kinase
MEKDAALTLKELMADGGITSNQFVMQFIADLLNKKVVSIPMPDVSALGAAYLAGLKSGVYENIAALKKLNSDKKIYNPDADLEEMNKNYEGWQKAIGAR